MPRLFTFQIKVVPNAYSGTFPLTRIHKIVNERFLRNLSVRKNSCRFWFYHCDLFNLQYRYGPSHTWAPLTPSKHLNRMLLHRFL